jgi:dTDP-4-dehydrorhamnose reductase
MRILILGGDGMLGHQLLRSLRDRYEIMVTLRQDLSAYAKFAAFTATNAVGGVDLRDVNALLPVIGSFRPDAIINAVGIVKQRPDANASIASLEVNALLPHRLSLLAKVAEARLVHLSTDCVFSGRKGSYTETDIADAEDLYGRSKMLGEVHDAHCITLRTSIIGLELSRKTSLIEWFLAQPGPINGFRRAIYSGFPTVEMARIIERLLTQHPEAGGLYHFATAPISKFDLLTRLARRLGRTIEIRPDDAFHCDRSLDASRARQAFCYEPPSWDVLLDELAVQISERDE